MADQPSGAAPSTPPQPSEPGPDVAAPGWHTTEHEASATPGPAGAPGAESHGASRGQPGPYAHAGAYGQPDPYAHAGAYGQPGPYAQPGGYGPPGPYAQPGGYGPPGPYAQPGGYGASGPYGPPGPGQHQPYVAGAYGPAPGPYGSPYEHGPWGSHPYGWHYGAAPAPARQPRSPEERRRLLRWAIAITGAAILAIGAGIGIGAWIAPTSPATVALALVSKSVAAATHAGTYHYSELSTLDGQPDNIVGDASPNGGRQVITQRGASGQTDIFDLRLVNDVVYFRGNAAAVVDQLGVPTAKANTDAGKWISLKKGQGNYATFADGITTKSNISQLTTTFKARSSSVMAGTSPQTTRIDGGLILGKGHTPVGTAQLVMVTSTSLPRTLSGEVETSAARYTIDWTFSHFGAHVSVAAPSGAVPYSSLGAKAPSTKG